MSVRPFRFGLSAVRGLESRRAWQDLARRVEDDGWSVLLRADHLGMASTFVPLVSAAEVTGTLRFGTFVTNSDFYRPLRLAQEAATVDLLTDGRLELGLGSGWNKPEYDLMGVAYDRPRIRGGRLADAVATMKQAWAGQPDLGGTPAVPAPAQRPHPPLLIGGHGDVVLRLAATEADIVGFTGATWTGSSLEPTGASVEALAERVGYVRSAAGDRFDRLELNILVQVAEVGERAAGRVDEIATALGAAPEVVRASPLALLGSENEVVEKLLGIRETLGLSYFVVFDAALDGMAPVVARLAGQ